MANPLAILGNLAGGLAGIGASGAEGAYTGQLEGEQLRRKNETQDIDNQLRMLRGYLLKQQIGPQYRVDPYGRIIMESAGQAPRMTGELPQPPLNPLQEATAAWHRAQTEALGREKTPQIDAKTKAAHDAWRSNPANAGKSYMDFLREYTAATHPEPRLPHPASHFTTDAQGNVTEIKPDGSRVQHGQIGKPMRPSGVGLSRETLTETTKVTPRKQITKDEDVARINNAIPALVNEITGQFRAKGLNFDVPGAYVKLPSGKMVRKEEVISQAMRERAGIEVSVRWDQSTKKFVLLKAWDPEQREPIETRRTTGPARQGVQEPDEED